MLEKLGLLDADERKIAIRLARAQMEQFTETPIKHDGLDLHLIAVWPCHLRLFDHDPRRGTRVAAWIATARSRELTAEEYDGITTDATTMYASVVVARSLKRSA